MYPIISKKRLNNLVEQMVIKAPFVARSCQAGQFIIVRTDETSERVPLTIADYSREEETVTIIYQVVGQSTKRLSELSKNDHVLDFVGPLGMPSPLPEKGRVLVIGGGVGIAPLYPQIKALHNSGVKVDAILGGRNASMIILEDEITDLVESIYFATDDGSKGIKGFVTQVLEQLLNHGERYDEVIAIGPIQMMQAVVSITKAVNIPTSVSLNPIMIDGTGMCGGCRVSIAGETKFACVDGPDFDGFKVDFDGIINRQSFYKDVEPHVCNLDSHV